MKKLIDYENDIHSCSKCGLCQSVCPIYKITGNDCTVSRGHFIMLRGLIKGDLKLSKKINHYLDMCLKCGACTKFCPSEIDVVNIVALAKAEYFKNNCVEKIISLFQKIFIFKFGIKILSLLNKKTKSKVFDKKVIFFGGCKGEVNKNINKSLIKLLNACGIEVLNPHFDCCGIPFFVRGDMKSFYGYMESFLKKMEEQNCHEIVTTCASCEKVLKSYKNWGAKENYSVRNIFEYLRENNIKLSLQKKTRVTFHKPCNINNYEDIKWILLNTKNLEYIEMQEYDSCCGMNGISKISEFKTMFELYKNKRAHILNTKSKIVLTSCLGCEFALKIFSLGKYKVKDLTEFLGENLKK